MKRIILLTAALLAWLGVQGQTGTSIEQVLRTIETNNKELKANAQLITSKKLAAKTDNNLPDPSLSYSYLWGAKDKDQTIGELTVSQRFDFPSLYITRHHLNRTKMGAFDGQMDLFRQGVLLQAKEVCLDIIMLRKQKEILQERLKNAQELSVMYKKRLLTGDANAIEHNKINLELLNVKTEAALNQTALGNKIQQLRVLNGSIPVVFEESTYVPIALPSDYETLRLEVMASDYALQTLTNQSVVARKQIGVNKQQWLPKLEVGYRRNSDAGRAFNGMIVGFSFPIFDNRHKVKMAKAQSLQADLQKEQAVVEVESDLGQWYQEAITLRSSMDEYEQVFESQQDLALLKEALMGGQIGMIEYFVELSVVYQSKQNYLQLENQYQRIVAKIYKNRL